MRTALAFTTTVLLSALLAGGASYANIFTGGAAESHFCPSALGWGEVLRAANPFTLAFLRVMLASAILLTWAWRRGDRLRLTRGEFGLHLGSGILLWVGGNGLVTWAEMRAASGLAALLVAAMPIRGEMISNILDRRPPTGRHQHPPRRRGPDHGVGPGQVAGLGANLLLEQRVDHDRGRAPVFQALQAVEVLGEWLRRRRHDGVGKREPQVFGGEVHVCISL